jgi:hypothetical protein
MSSTRWVYCPAAGFRGLEFEPSVQGDAEDGTEIVGPADIRRLLEQLRATATLDDLLGRAVRIMRTSLATSRLGLPVLRLMDTG